MDLVSMTGTASFASTTVSQAENYGMLTSFSNGQVEPWKQINSIADLDMPHEGETTFKTVFRVNRSPS